MSTAPGIQAVDRIAFDRPAQIRAALIAGAFFLVFWKVFRDLWYVWTHSADWSHGPIIPLFSAYLVYLHWDKIRAAPIRHVWVGFGVMVLGLAGYAYFLWVLKMAYPQQTMMLVTLLGAALLLNGLPILKHIWVPWLYLFFALPLPKAIYFALTDPLRQIAATVATQILSLMPELYIERVGSTIDYMYRGTSGQLGVVDACSGMRAAMTLCALGVAITFASQRPWWHRIIMIAACLPIAVLSNLIRVTTTCVLHIFVDPKYATGMYHTSLGLVTLLIAFGIFAGLGWLLNNLVVEDDDEDEQPHSEPAQS